jgi:hypothetical protein
MKSCDQPPLSFSAYSLKAVARASANTSGQSPFLKAILSGKNSSVSRARISPMLNTYKRIVKSVSPSNGKLKKDAEPTSNEWFNNYE